VNKNSTKPNAVQASDHADREGHFDLKGVTPESWACIDCGINTAPGHPTRVELERLYKTSVAIEKLSGEAPPLATLTFNDRCEVYTVRNSVWKAAGMEPFGGCLCIGCLENRLGRRLTSKDFPHRHPFNSLPGTERLIERRDVQAADHAGDRA
jgi:hypothetical protein